MIYLDHNATTPILPEVLEAMMPYLTTEWGNPSSAYKFGSKLKSVIETARAQVAELIGAHATEVIFTSCGTESNNTAIAAALKANPGKRHIVTSQVEHSAVLNYCMALEKGGSLDPSFPRRLESTASPSTAGTNMDPRFREGDNVGLPSFPHSAVIPVKTGIHSTLFPRQGESTGYRVTYLPVDRDGLLFLCRFN